MQRWNRIRKAPCGAVCAVILTCVSASGSARPQQTASGPASAGASGATAVHPTSNKSSSTTTKSGTTHTSAKRSSRRKKSARVRGQQKIDSDRAREIQEALIREHYLGGEPTGSWNQSSEDAMRHYQEDHGWQTKEVPDSRALIKLGLGPSKDHLLNPERAMTTVPDAPRSDSPAPTSNTPPPVSNAPGAAPATQGDSSRPQ